MSTAATSGTGGMPAAAFSSPMAAASSRGFSMSGKTGDGKGESSKDEEDNYKAKEPGGTIYRSHQQEPFL